MVAAEKKRELGVSIVVPLFNEEGSAREATD